MQSALLEAMQEKQVSIGDVTYPLEMPFLVIATQNPIEQQGTYPLPEAQQDRFMLKLRIGYPNRREESEIIDRFSVDRNVEASVRQVLTRKTYSRSRKRLKTYMWMKT